jgi:hypothetical protein
MEISEFFVLNSSLLFAITNMLKLKPKKTRISCATVIISCLYFIGMCYLIFWLALVKMLTGCCIGDWQTRINSNYSPKNVPT